jgi:hypothetical protein
MTNWLVDIGKKHGITGFLIVWLLWTNQRLSRVESELYKCYDNTVKLQNQTSNDYIPSNKYNYAILTKREKYANEEMESENA